MGLPADILCEPRAWGTSSYPSSYPFDPMQIRTLTSRLVHSELGETVAKYDARKPLRDPETVAALFRRMIGEESQEVFAALLVDATNRPLAVVEVSRGTLTSSLVHPREVFGPALRMGTASLFVAHNHPSGDPTPSAEDFAVTRRLADAGELLGVPLLDHLVIGEGDSFRSAK